jgi:hypothetical protein
MQMSTDLLLFYSKSKDYVPGRLHQEYVDNPDDYSELNTISNWRHVLSNFYAFDFTVEVAPDTVLTFRTIEHGFHYFKIHLANPLRAFEFALESGTSLSKGSGADAQRARKMVILSVPLLRIWDQQKERTMELLAKCRYSQDPHSKRVLLLTKRAQLWHIVPRKAPVRFTHLECIRDELK